MTDTVETPARPNRRVQAKARTRQRVLESAAAQFAGEGGYVAATIREIAKGAGMSTGAIFANFDDKAALYAALHGHAPVLPEVGRTLLLMLVHYLYGADAMLALTGGEPIPEEERQKALEIVATAARGPA